MVRGHACVVLYVLHMHGMSFHLPAQLVAAFSGTCLRCLGVGGGLGWWGGSRGWVGRRAGGMPKVDLRSTSQTGTV
jgi:hypothetical protein